MNNENIRKEYGYDGKSKQWQYGFDAGLRELHSATARLETENERLAYLLKETLDRLEKLRQQNENNL